MAGTGARADDAIGAPESAGFAALDSEFKIGFIFS
jgi:hypothetical protein